MKDANYIPVLMGENPSGEVVPLKVSSSGELVVEYVVDGATPSGTNRVKRDDNYVPVKSAEYNNNIVAVHTNNDGYVLVSGLTIS